MIKASCFAVFPHSLMIVTGLLTICRPADSLFLTLFLDQSSEIWMSKEIGFDDEST